MENIRIIGLLAFMSFACTQQPKESIEIIGKQISELKLDYRFSEVEIKINGLRNQFPENNQAQNLIADWSHFIMDFVKADSLYTNVLVRDPGNIDALNGKAMIALDNMQVERSLELMTKAIEIDSTNTTSWVNYSKVMLEIRDRERVITALNKAIECDSLNAEAYARKGFYYAALRYNIDEGGIYFNKAIEINPLTRIAHHYLGRGYSPSNYNDDKPLTNKVLLKVDSLLRINQFESAHTLITAEHSDNSNDINTLKLMAACEFHLSNYRRTIEYAFKILELKPNYGLVHYFIAESLNQLKYKHNILIKEFKNEYKNRQVPPAVPFLEDVFINYDQCESDLQKIIRINTSQFGGFMEALALSDATVYFMDFHHLMYECPHLVDTKGTRSVDFRLADDIKGQGGYHMTSNKLQQSEEAYGMFNVAFHEFGHLIQWLFTYEQNTELMHLFTEARTKKRTLDWYADMNIQEYFAQGIEAYLSERKLPGQSNTSNNIKDELMKKDPELFKFIESLVNQESYQRHIIQGLIVKSWYADSNKDAFRVLENALEKYSNNPELLMELGNLYRDQSDFQNAEKFHRRALNISPNNLQAKLELSYDIFLEGRNKEMSIEILETLKGEPKFDAKMYRFLGFYYAGTADSKNAIKYLEIAKTLEPFPDPYEMSLPDVFFLLAETQLEIKDYHAAEENLLKSLDVNRGNAETYAELAFVNQQQNNTEQAAIYLQTAVQLNPGNARVIEVKESLIMKEK